MIDKSSKNGCIYECVCCPFYFTNLCPEYASALDDDNEIIKEDLENEKK